MKTKIDTHYPHHVIEDHYSHIYISDYTEHTKNDPVKRGVEITPQKPNDLESFFIKNDKPIPFSSIKFDNKSFVDDTTGETLSQCECICFSQAEYSKGPWILLLELKYCSSSSINQLKNIAKAKDQLTRTYDYYKKKGIINNKQQCYLVVSLPLVQPPFFNFSHTQSEVRDMKLKKIIFRGVNQLKIKNEFKLDI